MSRQYVTTAIDYPNAAPHLGHVLEKIIADVAVRWFRLRGDDVRFQIGTDEHGVKIQKTAEREGISPQELVDRTVPGFQELYNNLDISFDVFIRTSDQKTHWPTVKELWKKLENAGMLEKRSYTGLYCSGCERFMAQRDLVDGVCPDHKVSPEDVMEENWFYLLSKDEKNLKNLLSKKWDGESYRIVPEFREKETMALLKNGLEDISFSRSKSSLSWGIPIPGDDEQTMYVWCDALTNYISGIGYFTNHEEREWWDEANVTHVIGKDIARFHALYWPSMLHAAGVRMPNTLLIHGFLSNKGEKMSKSTGNVVNPVEVLEHFGKDAMRFYLTHEVPLGRDGDFSWDRMQKLYDAKLRNDIGNLLNRVLVLLAKDGGSLSVPRTSVLLDEQWKTYSNHMNAFEFSEAVEIACNLSAHCNRFIDEKKPWKLDGKEKAEVLGILAENLRHIALMLLPFIPESAQKMCNQLNVPYMKECTEKDFVIGNLAKWGGAKDWVSIGKPEVLFAPIEE